MVCDRGYCGVFIVLGMEIARTISSDPFSVSVPQTSNLKMNGMLAYTFVKLIKAKFKL